jgi:hypothetical protein
MWRMMRAVSRTAPGSLSGPNSPSARPARRTSSNSRPALEQGSASGMDGAAYTADAAEAAAHIVGLEAAEFEGIRA